MLIATAPTRSYNGHFNLPDAAVNVGITRYLFTVDVSQMHDPLTHLTITLECSYDNGQSWNFWCSAERPGGPDLIAKDGITVLPMSISGPLDQPQNANRRVRGSVDIVGPITLGATVEVF